MEDCCLNPAYAFQEPGKKLCQACRSGGAWDCGETQLGSSLLWDFQGPARHHSSGFLSLSFIDIWGQNILCCGGLTCALQGVS